MKQRGMWAWILCFSIVFSTLGVHYVNAAQKGMKLVYDGKTHLYTASPITLMVNGQKIVTKQMPPVIVQDTTLVPAREVFEPLGATVEWKASSKETYITMGNTQIVLQMNNPIAQVNGIAKQMKMPSKIINDKTMIPARFVAEELNFTVEWKNKERIVVIDAPKPTTPEGTLAYHDTEEWGIEVAPPSKPEEQIPPAHNDTTINEQPRVEELGGGDAGVDLKTQAIIWQNIVEAGVNPIEQFNDIESQKHLLTDVLTSTAEGNRLTIKTSTPISQVKHEIIAGNRLVVDVYNANMKLKSTTTEIKNNPFVVSIRASQHQVSPEKITRVVFDLTNFYEYDAVLSSDRKELSFQIRRNSITKVQFSTVDEIDMVEIQGSFVPSTKIVRLTNPDRLVVDMSYADFLLGYREASIKGQFIQTVRTSQFDDNTVRLVMETRGQPDYEIVPQTNMQSQNTLMIRLKQPVYQNISYTNNEKAQVVLRKFPDFPIQISNIEHIEGYINKQYTLTLPGDFLAQYGQGTFKIDDGILRSVTLQNNKDNKTEIFFMANKVNIYEVSEDENNIYISLIKPKDRYKQIVVLDPGHGGRDPGAVHNGLKEKDLTLKVGLYLYELMQQMPQTKVYMTRNTDVYPEFVDRTGLANELEADLFISIHFNANVSTKPKGTEVYYLARKNEYEGTLTSKKAAQIMQNQLVSQLGTVNRGIKTENFIVLRNTIMPAVLLEIGFLSNAEDAQKFKNEENIWRSAQAIFNGIQQSFEQYSTQR